MNREIEFRGKHSDSWIYGYLLKDDGKYYIAKRSGLGSWHYVKTETIGQYTGLKDKNGKKIFEGDIVHYYDFTSVYSGEITGKVIYSQDCMFKIEYDDEFIKNHKTTRPLVCNEHPIFAEKKIEVIGNIYENDLESKGE